MGRKTRIITIKWTGTLTTGDNKPDNTDTVSGTAPIIIYMGGSETASVTLDTKGATTGSPTFDLHSYGTNDIGSWPAVTSHFQDAIFTAQAKNLVATATLTRGPRALKLLLDVNTASLAAGEYVVATVYLTEAS